MGFVLVRPVQTTSRTVSTSGHRRNLDCRGGSGFCTKESHNRLLVERPKFEKSTFPDCVPRVDFESCKGEAKALLDRSDNVKVKDENVEYVLYEDEACVRILDSNPLCDGHSLVLQKAHFPSLEVTLPQVAAAMRAAGPLISCVLMEATQSGYAEAAFERCAGSEDSSTHGLHQAHLQHSD
ncbi:unnamed protein product [Sphagnum troendelagicum]